MRLIKMENEIYRDNSLS